MLLCFLQGVKEQQTSERRKTTQKRRQGRGGARQKKGREDFKDKLSGRD